MPVVKSRGSKRSSSSGYSSTVTTIIFVALCVLGVWMLSSDTVAPPKSTTRMADTVHSSSIAEEEQESRDMEPAEKKKQQPVFPDSQVDLPEDAIKPDNEANKDESSEVSNDSLDGGTTNDPLTEVVGESNDKQDTGQQNDMPEGNDDGKPEEVQDVVTQDKKVDTGKGSEESSITQNQEPEEAKENQSKDSGGHDQDLSEKQNVKESSKDHKDSGSKQSQDNNRVEDEGPKEKSDQVISDEDQQKRVEQHQMQEDDQIQGQSQKENLEGTKDNENQKVSNQDVDKASKLDSKEKDPFPAVVNAGIPKESKDSKKSWATQADQSENEKERRKVGTEDEKSNSYGYEWQLCNVTAAADYIPCLDNEKAIAKLRSRRHFEHRERHCPEEAPTCLVQLPDGYKKPIEWPHSRDKVLSCSKSQINKRNKHF